MNNQTQKHYIGLDVSKDKIDVSIDKKTHFVIKNSPEGFKELFEKIKEFQKAKKLTGTPFFVLEQTGIYGMAFCLAVEKKKIEYACVNAARVKYFKQSEAKLAKTDKIDSHIIRRFGEEKKPQATLLPAKKFIVLRELHNHFCQLKKCSANLQNILEASTTSMSQRTVKHSLEIIEKEIEKLEKMIIEIINTDPEMALKRKSLLEVYGVSDITSNLLVICIPHLGEMSRREVAAFIGCAPHPNDSGKHKGKRSCFGGKNKIRAKLYMPVMSACLEKGSPLKKYHDSMEARGIKGNRLRICCTRKFIQYLNAKVAQDLAAFHAQNSAELATTAAA